MSLRPPMRIPPGACVGDVDGTGSGVCDAGDLSAETMHEVLVLRLSGRRDDARELERREVAKLNASRKGQKVDQMSERFDRAGAIAELKAMGFHRPNDRKTWPEVDDGYVAARLKAERERADSCRCDAQRTDAAHAAMVRVVRRDVELSGEQLAVRRAAERVDAEYRAFRRRDDREIARQADGSMGTSPRIVEPQRTDGEYVSEADAIRRASERVDAEYRAFASRDDAAAARQAAGEMGAMPGAVIEARTDAIDSEADAERRRRERIDTDFKSFAARDDRDAARKSLGGKS